MGRRLTRMPRTKARSRTHILVTALNQLLSLSITKAYLLCLIHELPLRICKFKQLWKSVRMPSLFSSRLGSDLGASNIDFTYISQFLVQTSRQYRRKTQIYLPMQYLRSVQGRQFKKLFFFLQVSIPATCSSMTRIWKLILGNKESFL